MRGRDMGLPAAPQRRVTLQNECKDPTNTLTDVCTTDRPSSYGSVRIRLPLDRRDVLSRSGVAQTAGAAGIVGTGLGRRWEGVRQRWVADRGRRARRATL